MVWSRFQRFLSKRWRLINESMVWFSRYHWMKNVMEFSFQITLEVDELLPQWLSNEPATGLSIFLWNVLCRWLKLAWKRQKITHHFSLTYFSNSVPQKLNRSTCLNTTKLGKNNWKRRSTWKLPTSWRIVSSKALMAVVMLLFAVSSSLTWYEGMNFFLSNYIQNSKDFAINFN